MPNKNPAVAGFIIYAQCFHQVSVTIGFRTIYLLDVPFIQYWILLRWFLLIMKRFSSVVLVKYNR